MYKEERKLNGSDELAINIIIFIWTLAISAFITMGAIYFNGVDKIEASAIFIFCSCLGTLFFNLMADLSSSSDFDDKYPSKPVSSLINLKETFLDTDLLFEENVSLNPFSKNKIQLVHCTVYDAVNPVKNYRTKHFLAKLKDKRFPILTYVVSGFFDSQLNNVSDFEVYVKFKEIKFPVFQTSNFSSFSDDFERIYQLFNEIFGMPNEQSFVKNWNCLQTYSHKNVIEKYIKEHYKNLANEFRFVKTLNRKERIKNFLVGCFKSLKFNSSEKREKYFNEMNKAFEKSLVKVN